MIRSKAQIALFGIGASLLFFIGLTGILVMQTMTGIQNLADGIICQLIAKNN